MNRTIPKALTERQEYQRQQTANKVLHAVDYLMSQGINLSTKNLMDCTGLSRSVFAKPHVRAVIDDHYSAYEEAAMEERKQNAKGIKRKAKTKAYKEHIHRLTTENEKLRDECALLRGRLMVLMQRLQE